MYIVLLSSSYFRLSLVTSTKNILLFINVFLSWLPYFMTFVSVITIVAMGPALQTRVLVRSLQGTEITVYSLFLKSG